MKDQQKQNIIKPPKIAFVRELCKDSTEEEIQAAEARLLEYLEVCEQIHLESKLKDRNNTFDK